MVQYTSREGVRLMWRLEKAFPRSQHSCVIARDQPANDLGEKHPKPREPQVQRSRGRSVFRAGAPG